MANGVIEAANQDDLRCANCGKHPGACSLRGATYDDATNDWVGGTWEIDYCEECGAGPEGFVEAAPGWDDEWRDEQQAIYDENDPGQSYGEEMRRLHEAQV